MDTNTPNETLPDLLKPREAWPILRSSRSTFYRKLREGEIPSIRFGRRRLIRKEDLLRLMTPKE
ncbi:MAG: helix-turn-helix domain-containing protein [Nitrospiraceae bacterium]